jgi:cysteine-rich repeat protein
VAGYALNGSVCGLCGDLIAQCLSCTDRTTCTGCNSTGNWVLFNSKCVCNTSYTLNNGQCTSCSAFMPNCLNCQTNSICSSCQTGYYLSNVSSCVSCSAALVGCGSCSISTLCSGCVDNYYLFNGKCTLCNASIAGCASCSSNSTCTACNATGNFIVSGSSCVCATGFVLNGSFCAACKDYLPSCQTCSSNTTCLSCSDNSYVFASTGCTKCSASMGGCLNCTSATACTICDAVLNYVAQGSNCRCKDGYTLNGKGCELCSDFLTGCDNCSSQTLCTTCQNGYVLNATTCSKCSELFIGCANCTSAAACQVCDSAGFFTLSSGQCVCQSGYIINGTACVPCSSFVVGCSLCSSQSSCSQCLTADNFVMVGGVCVCDTGYVLNASNCVSCATAINGCELCNSTTTCTQCNAAQHFTLSNSLCQCDISYFASSGSCLACSPNCLTCIGAASSCTNCASGKFLANATCMACPAGCATCASLAKCLSCASTFSLVKSKCVCPVSSFLDGATTACIACHATCYACSGTQATDCLSCVDVQFRVLSGGSCVCNTSNYVEDAAAYPKCRIVDAAKCRDVEFWDGSACQEICGDGKLYTLECDDGNNADGDGCSRDCHIEEGFTCVNGTWGNQSLCSYTGQLQFILRSNVKDPNANLLTITFDVVPALAILKSLPDLSSLITTNIPNSRMSVTYEQGRLVVQIAYTSTVQGVVASVVFNPPSDSNSTFAMQSSEVQFAIEPTNNEPANYYDNTTYETKNKTDAAVVATEATAFSAMAVGAFVAKSLSLELLSVLQTTYLTMSTVNNVNPVTSSLYNLRYMSGYNRLFDNLGIEVSAAASSRRLLQSSGGSEALNARLQALGYSGPHLIQNFNYMYMAMVFLVLAFGIVYLVGKYKDFKRTLKVGVFGLKNVVFTFLFFSVNNMGFSLGLQFKYLSAGQVWDAFMVVSWLLAILTLVLLAVYLYFYIKSFEGFEDYHDKFKEDRWSQIHYPILLVARYLLNLFCGVFNEHGEICYAVVAFEVGCLVYIIIKRPYKQKLDNGLAILNEVIILIIISINMYYRNLTNGETINGTIITTGWVQIALVILCVVANYVGLMYHIYLKCCKKNQVHDGSHG